MRQLFRFWFTFEAPVNRRQYFCHGLLLAAIKYAGDVLIVLLGAGRFWSPLDYVQSRAFVVASEFDGGSASLWAALLVLWTLPFLWAGVTLTVRRLLDAGWSAWWSLLFFVPVLNYLMIAALVVSPSCAREPSSPSTGSDPHAPRLPGALLSIALGSAVGLALIWVGVGALRSYGLGIFLGTPFVIGVVTGFALRRRYPATSRETHEVITMTLLVVAGAALLTGIEGAVCLLMIAPLGLAIALLGGATGRYLAIANESSLAGAIAVVLFPMTIAAEPSPDRPQVREVVSVVEIDAPPGAVWDAVIAFPRIAARPPILFRLGLAYPEYATIDGAGVGAIRYCVFSTGAFVEPITAWVPDSRLAFDVVDSPPPLRELSPWQIKPPHLDGYLLPQRGEFRLTALPGGRTRLEGSTWYVQHLRPEAYWVLYSNYFIGSIHRRVLDHIKAVAEQRLASRTLQASAQVQLP